MKLTVILNHVIKLTVMLNHVMTLTVILNHVMKLTVLRLPVINLTANNQMSFIEGTCVALDYACCDKKATAMNVKLTEDTNDTVLFLRRLSAGHWPGDILPHWALHTPVLLLLPGHCRLPPHHASCCHAHLEHSASPWRLSDAQGHRHQPEFGRALPPPAGQRLCGVTLLSRDKPCPLGRTAIFNERLEHHFE